MTAQIWLFNTDAGLATRIAVGLAIFLVLALIDLRRHGPNARRWREYLFLAAVVALAMAYGVVNDQITSRISWEYFYYGKGLAANLGTATPPRQASLSWEATKVGLKATWTVGLIVGVAFLLANNPRPGRPQLSYRSLIARLPWVFLTCIACAAALGAAGYTRRLAVLSDDFRQMVLHDEMRPGRFMAVYGIHLGGYVGGALGTLWAVISICRARAATPPNPA